MRLDVRDYEIYSAVDDIEGWLHRVTGLTTMMLLRWQSSQGIEGNLLEIGVFCGKYFSLLVHSAIETKRTALGIDTFEFTDQTRVYNDVKNALGDNASEHLNLWQMQSSRTSAGEIETEIGLPRFISIDGAHDYENVYRDLVLCESILSPDGIIAADDFLNPLTLGVNQAVNEFLRTPRNVVPVAYVSNKLFLAHRSREEDYRGALERIILNGKEPQNENFRKQLQHGRHHVEQPLFGHKVLIC